MLKTGTYRTLKNSALATFVELIKYACDLRPLGYRGDDATTG